MLWHRRFRHMGFDNLARLQHADITTGIKVSESQFNAAGQTACDFCIMAKQHKISRRSSKSDSSQELLHMDMCGPLEVQSLGGSRYLSTYLDDFSKLAVIVLLALKSDVLATTMLVIRCLEQLSGRSLVKARSDNCTEYVNKNLAQFFNSKGVVHETTARYTPEQNGAAGRLNRMIVQHHGKGQSDA